MISSAEEVAQNSTVLDLELIRKYSISGPRYTSYPPATKFTTDLAALDLERALQDDTRWRNAKARCSGI